MAIIGDDTYGTIDPEKTAEMLDIYKVRRDEENAAEEAQSV